MALYCDEWCRFKGLFHLGLALNFLVAALVANGQQAGVSLKLYGLTIPNNSLVEFGDLLYLRVNDPYPTNANGLHDQGLVCVTDLVDCCNTPRTVHGNWHYPNGSIVDSDPAGRQRRFLSNRGLNEVISGRQFYGSVRLFRRWTPVERGRFRCEIPSANYVTKVLYANIVDFGITPVTISSSGSRNDGETYSLTCSVNLVAPFPLPSDIPTPTLWWFFGDAALPSNVTTMETVLSRDNRTYSSTLQFSPLRLFHTGRYTCSLGPRSLTNSFIVIVNAPTVSVEITASIVEPLLGDFYIFTCVVTGGEALPSKTYQWTKNNGSQTQVLDNDQESLSFANLRLSDAGQYTCQVNLSSPCLIHVITEMSSHDIRTQIPPPISVILSSNLPSPIRPVESDVTLTCTVILTTGPGIDIPLNVNFELSRREPIESRLATTPQSVSGSAFTTTTTINSFGREQSGEYTCVAAISSINRYLTDVSTRTNSLRVTTGVYLELSGVLIANNSQVNINNIGLSSDIPNGALQCITDRDPCCFSQNPRLGEWYLPNRTLVHEAASNSIFYRNRGDSGNVSLNRPSDVMSPIGLFCCEVPDATDTNQTLCVNIDEVSIRVSGSLIAGKSPTLECFAGGSMGTFQWLGPPDGMSAILGDGSVTISSNSTLSQLQFRPLKQSYNGLYSCRVSTGRQNLLSQPLDIRINAPSITVQISDNINGATPIVGETYILICDVSGTENLNPVITYKWTKNSNSTSQMQVKSNSSILSFIALQLSDAANYACIVTISSSYLTSDITAMKTQEIRIQIPIPSTVTLTNSEGDSTVIVGSDVTLTCTVELHSAVLGSEIFLLTVDAQLFRDGTPLALIGPTVTGTTFTYTTQLNSFGRSDSGRYSCTATIRPHPTSTYLTMTEVLSDILRIKATSAPPVNVQASQSSSAGPVEVSWSPPSDGANIITGYRLFYGNGQNVSVPSVITYIGLVVKGSYIGQTVSLQSEADQLYSELINVTIGADGQRAHRHCSTEVTVGIAVGVTIVVLCIFIMVATVIVVLCRRKKPSDSSEDNCGISTNMAYGQMDFKPVEMGEIYDEINNETDSRYSKTRAATCETKKLASPEYASTDEPMYL